MSPGTDLKAVALPEIPQGHRWVIDRRKVRMSSWGDSYKVRSLAISLEAKAVTWRGKEKWRVVDSRAIGDADPWHVNETLVQSAERLAQEIKKQHLAKLEKLLTEESLIGTYEPHQNKALPSV